MEMAYVGSAKQPNFGLNPSSEPVGSCSWFIARKKGAGLDPELRGGETPHTNLFEIANISLHFCSGKRPSVLDSLPWLARSCGAAQRLKEIATSTRTGL